MARKLRASRGRSIRARPPSESVESRSLAPTLRHALVQDVMRPGIVTCPPDADLVAVARLMIGAHIHAIVVSGIETVPGGERLTWGLITALDLVASTQPGYEGAEAADLASSEIVTVDMDEPLERAAQLNVRAPAHPPDGHQRRRAHRHPLDARRGRLPGLGRGMTAVPPPVAARLGIAVA
jgi:CBS domain-containing protein